MIRRIALDVHGQRQRSNENVSTRPGVPLDLLETVAPCNITRQTMAMMFD